MTTTGIHPRVIGSQRGARGGDASRSPLLVAVEDERVGAKYVCQTTPVPANEWPVDSARGTVVEGHGDRGATGWGQPEDRLRSEEAGFDHHLVKPVDDAALERLLAESSSWR